MCSNFCTTQFEKSIKLVCLLISTVVTNHNGSELVVCNLSFVKI